MQKILMVVVGAAILYMLMQQGASMNSATGAVQGSCVDALHAQYAPRWAEMNQLQRAIVGAQAAAAASTDGGCAP